MEPYTVTLTSCARFDLLEQTLASLVPRLEGPCERIIIGEDSGDARVFEVAERFRANAPPIHIIVNRRCLGICRNIDRIYAEVETEWIFHCEDDWEFYRSGFIRDSFSIMSDDSISAVSLRDIAETRPGSRDSWKLGYWLPAGDAHYVANIEVAGDMAGLHFSPGLRRMRDYRVVGKYGRLAIHASEPDVSRAYLAAGWRMALLKRPAVRHIGWERRVRRQRGLAGRISRQTRKVLSWVGCSPPLWRHRSK